MKVTIKEVPCWWTTQVSCSWYWEIDVDWKIYFPYENSKRKKIV